jgi:hypothetical protein
LKPAAVALDPFAHAGEPMTRGHRSLRSPPAVDDLDPDAFHGVANGDLGRRGAGVLERVRECFLDDAAGGTVDGGGQRLRVSEGPEPDGQAGPSHDLEQPLEVGDPRLWSGRRAAVRRVQQAEQPRKLVERFAAHVLAKLRFKRSRGGKTRARLWHWLRDVERRERRGAQAEGIDADKTGRGLRHRSGIRRWRWSVQSAERARSMICRRLKSFAARRLVVGVLSSTLVFGVASAPAVADPVDVHVIGGNCHGVAVAAYASADPEGLGRYVENVRQFQEDVDDFVCP